MAVNTVQTYILILFFLDTFHTIYAILYPRTYKTLGSVIDKNKLIVMVVVTRSH